MKFDSKTVLVSALVSLLMCVITGCTVFGLALNKFALKGGSTSDVPVVKEQYDEGEKLPSGATASEEKGGEKSITLADGTTVEFHIPEDHYEISDDYKSLVQAAYGLDSAVTSDNLIVTGNVNNVNMAETAITATTFADTANIYSQIYGDAFDEVNIEDTYPPAYVYMQSGEIPETPYSNYTVTELGEVATNDMAFKAFKVEYDMPIQDYDENGEIVESTEHVCQLAAYSNTADVIEVIVDEESSDMDKAMNLLTYFVTGK